MLTPRQERFAAVYAVCGDEKEAATQAGYNPQTAQATGKRLLKNEAVRQAVETLCADAASHDQVTQEWVTARLKEVAERCMQAVPAPPPKGKGDGVTEYRFDASNANRALSLLGKYLQMFSEKGEPQTGNHEDRLDELE